MVDFPELKSPFVIPKNIKMPGRNWKATIMTANPMNNHTKSPLASFSAPLAAKAEEALQMERARVFLIIGFIMSSFKINGLF
jgi:hypothetical protein